MELTVIQKTMIEEFQCPGCVMGMDVTCGSLKLDDSEGFSCKGHRAGTILNGSVRFNLGLPKGFSRVIYADDPFANEKEPSNIRLHADSASVKFDRLNVPVWAMESTTICSSEPISRAWTENSLT
jgi:hypothetical protein